MANNERKNDVLIHYGTPRHSGRYPWGSGENPYQRNANFLKTVHDKKASGIKETEIAREMGMNTRQLRAKIALANASNRKAREEQARKLKAKGYSTSAIGRAMGESESTVRSLLDPAVSERMNKIFATSDALKQCVEEKRYIDIGEGVEQHLGVTQDKLKKAVDILVQEGYKVMPIYPKQSGTGKNTTVKVLAKADVTYNELWEHIDKIDFPKAHSDDYGKTYDLPDRKLKDPASIDSKRIQVVYTDEEGHGGKEKDGVIELRRGVAELSLGNSHYAQVRIAVDGTHYMKGMAVYADDLPDGVDIRYNSKYPEGTPKDKVFKKMEYDEYTNNPFGASVTQKNYIDANGNERLSPINLVNEEGTWADWSKNLPSQFLSKQPLPLIKQQLKLAADLKHDEFDEIMSLTNDVVKKSMLQEFANECDSAAVHLKAASMPRQQTHVILPVSDIGDDEVYAPRYNQGETVVLVRFPHGGKFELPQLRVNNHSEQGRSMISPEGRDAVGITTKTAAKLSGADFDGDTVIVLPNDSRSIKVQESLTGLKGFDPSEAYPSPYDDPKKKTMTIRQRNQNMGYVTNLITDMTIGGATPDELTRAVRHSMVVIDAYKHNLNWKKSAEDNRIQELYLKYQGKKNGGAATLISLASGQKSVDYRKEKMPDKETGERVYEYTGETKWKATKKDENGKPLDYKLEKRTLTSTKMFEAKDARELSSGLPQEEAYAVYANDMKDLANQARKQWVNLKTPKMNPSAKEYFAAEVKSLMEKLRIAESNRPLERKATMLYNYMMKQQLQDNPELYDDADARKKISGRLMEAARAAVGAHKIAVEFTPREWEAVQAGAVSSNVLSKLLTNAKSDHVKQLAMPKTLKGMSDGKIARARALLAQGRTYSEVADMIGVSVSTIDRALNKKESE